MIKEELKDKMLGCLYGQAIGNALGLVTEFMDKETVKNQYPTQLRKYPYNQGNWQDDDTTQMLCLLEELKDNMAIIPQSLAKKLENWLETDGRGCGNLVYNVINHRDFLINPFLAAYDRWKLSQCEAAPNGGIMRTSVIGLLRDNVIVNAEAACKVTHYDPRCVGSCVIASQIIHSLIWEQRELTYEDIKNIALKYDNRIVEWIDLAYSGTLSDLCLGEFIGMGYTLKTLSAALWCYWHAMSFEDGLVAIVNEGGDADTNAAISCAILGAKFGYSSIPKYYIDNLSDKQIYHNIITEFINMIINIKTEGCH